MHLQEWAGKNIATNTSDASSHKDEAYLELEQHGCIILLLQTRSNPIVAKVASGEHMITEFVHKKFHSNGKH